MVIAQIDYLKEGAPECPLVRIYGPREAISELLEAVRKLCEGTATTVAVQDLPSFQPRNCCLLLCAGNRDEAIRQESSTKFSWTLTRSGWCKIAGVIEPFAELPTGHFHQWLSGNEARWGLGASHVALLLSTDGRW
jgi:hypothetical protein